MRPNKFKCLSLQALFNVTLCFEYGPNKLECL
jgi:hypothetical protein